MFQNLKIANQQAKHFVTALDLKVNFKNVQ